MTPPSCRAGNIVDELQITLCKNEVVPVQENEGGILRFETKEELQATFSLIWQTISKSKQTNQQTAILEPKNTCRLRRYKMVESAGQGRTM